MRPAIASRWLWVSVGALVSVGCVGIAFLNAHFRALVAPSLDPG